MGVRYFVMGIRFEFIFVRINILFADDLFELFNQLRGNFTFCHNTYLQIVKIISLTLIASSSHDDQI